MMVARLLYSDIVEIQADAAEVWSVLIAFEDYGAWNPLCHSISVTNEIGGLVRMEIDDPRSDGTRFLDYRLAALDPPRLLAWESEFPELALTARRDQIVQSLGEGRSLYLTTDLYSGEGAVAAYEENSRWVRSSFSEMALALKRRVEQRP
jgi:hypothetical protein